jgi:hypothetical protein
MLRTYRSLRKIFASLLLVAMGLSLAEAQLPDDCDGHSLVHLVWTTAGHSESPTPEHSGTAPHVCHTGHGHTADATEADLEIGLVAEQTISPVVREMVVISASLIPPLRPPIG